MADVHKVVFYPVGNGDTTQIVLSGGRRVLFDFCHRERAEDTDTPEIDLKSRFKDELKAVDRDYFDVVAEGGYIHEGPPVRVVEADRFRIVVEALRRTPTSPASPADPSPPPAAGPTDA